MEEPELLTIKEAARRLNVSRGMIYRMIKDGRLVPVTRAAYKAGQYLIPDTEIAKYQTGGT